MSHAPLAVTLYADHNQQQLAYDVIILLVLVVNIAAGVRQGLIRRSISLAGVFGGAAAATWLGNSAVSTASQPSLTNNAWGFVAIFGVVVVMVEILSLLYADQIERTASLVFDRVAGAFMGLVVGVLQVGLLVVVVLAVGDAQPSPGHSVGSNHISMANDVRTSTLGGLFAQSDGGLRSIFTPVLPPDFSGHLTGTTS